MGNETTKLQVVGKIFVYCFFYFRFKITILCMFRLIGQCG